MKTNYNSEEIYCIALSLIKGIGYTQTQKLICHFGTAENLYNSSIKEIAKTKFLPRRITEEILSKKTISLAQELISKHIKEGISLLTPYDSLYPFRLKHIPDAPTLLFCKGIEFLNHTKIISIVGTRNATPYGKKVVQNLIAELIDLNPLILSGLAYGIDITAHKTAIELGLPTIAVYAGGIDIIYPKDHAHIAEKITKYGGLITEYPIGTKIEVYQFPARNRIVAGMTDAVVVIEAPKKSGALITAIYANDYDREVFAVPDNIFNKNAIGCHNLITNNQAHLLTSAKDLIKIMNWDNTQKKKDEPKQLVIDLGKAALSEKENLIVNIISQNNSGIHIDNLVNITDLSIGQLSSILLNLEMSGYITCMPGKKYKIP